MAGSAPYTTRPPLSPSRAGKTVSIDEMTGIQALERAAQSLPMKGSYVFDKHREVG